MEAELVARDVEADVERLVEVGLLLERGGVPRFGARQLGIGNGIDDGAETPEHLIGFGL